MGYFIPLLDSVEKQCFFTTVIWDTTFHYSGQISIIPKPELRGFWVGFPYKTTIWGDLAINCPDYWTFLSKNVTINPGPLDFLCLAGFFSRDTTNRHTDSRPKGQTSPIGSESMEYIYLP